MRTFLLSVLVLLFTASAAYSSDVVSEVYNPPIAYNANTDWANDYLVSAAETFGKSTGVYRASNSSIYIAVPDTGIMAGKSLVIMMSSNNGANWSIAGSTTTGTIVSKTKMVGRTTNDSLYCFFVSGSTLYTWNVVTNFLNPFTNYTDINYFDAMMTSTNNLYLIIDRNINNEVRLFSTLNSGASWLQTVNLSSTAASPNMNLSATGDTALISYYGVAITPDTISSAIRTVRYRESVPGTLLIVGTFATPIAGGTPKPQFKAALSGGKAWLFYSSGTAGSMDMNCIQSNDNGTTFGAPFTIGSMPGRDEFWFDCAPYTLGAGGVDLVYCSDSTGVTPPTNSSRRLYYSLANTLLPSSFLPSVQISQRPPVFSSTRNYYPSIIEFYNTAGDLGVSWVGLNGTTPGVYFDRYAAITHINPNSNVIPDNYVLEQNYPNPFNPETNINFSLPKDSRVTLRVFDLAGKEVATLLNNEFKTANSYTVKFNGIGLASGIYFYRIETGDFMDSKKMILIK